MKKTWRLYTGADGQSHLEPIDIEKKGDWLKGLPTTQISFSVWPKDRFLDWHPAPRAWSRTPPARAIRRGWWAASRC